MRDDRSDGDRHPRREAQYSAFFEFSGALSDTGNYDSVHGRSPSPYFEGRTTNGLVAGELLAESLGLSADPSLHLVGPVRGTNFAVRDALASGDRHGDLAGQVSAYLDSRDGRADPNALHFVFNGGNDVIQAVMTTDHAGAAQVLLDAVDGLERAICRLIEAGARSIMAPDFIDVSLVPAVRKGPDVERARLISEFYNQSFRRMLKRVESQFNVRLIHWSFDAFLKKLINHGEEFGLSNTTDPCEALLSKGACDSRTFVYLTEVFPTARVHELMAAAMKRAICQQEGVR